MICEKISLDVEWPIVMSSDVYCELAYFFEDVNIITNDFIDVMRVGVINQC